MALPWKAMDELNRDTAVEIKRCKKKRNFPPFIKVRFSI